MSLRKNPPHTRHPLWLWIVLWIALGWSGMWACKARPVEDRPMHLQHQGSHPQAPTPQQRQALERKLLASLAIARSHHRRATLYELRGSLLEALREIDAIIALRFPKGYRPGEEMRLDAWGRKALLYLKHHQPKRAKQTIEQALQQPSWLATSFYRAQLHHIHGRILAKMKLPQEALQAFQRSIEHNKAVIREAQEQLNQRHGKVGAPQTPGGPR